MKHPYLQCQLALILYLSISAPAGAVTPFDSSALTPTADQSLNPDVALLREDSCTPIPTEEDSSATESAGNQMQAEVSNESTDENLLQENQSRVTAAVQTLKVNFLDFQRGEYPGFVEIKDHPNK